MMPLLARGETMGKAHKSALALSRELFFSRTLSDAVALGKCDSYVTAPNFTEARSVRAEFAAEARRIPGERAILMPQGAWTG
jgi:hypothetical protein